MKLKMHSMRAVAMSMALLLGAGSASLVEASTTTQDAPPTMQDAMTLQNSADYEKAATAWRAILESNPDNGAAWFNLGYSLHMLGRLDEAKEVHRKASEYEQFKGIALYNLACAEALQGNVTAAVRTLSASQEAGFDAMGNAPDDSDFDRIREHPQFVAIMGGEQQEAPPAQSSGRSQSGQPNVEQLFQFVGMRLGAIAEEMAPQIERRMNALAQQAMGHAQELMGQFQQKVMQDEQLMGAIQQVQQALMQDPRFRGIMEQAERWIGQRMGGGQASSQSAASTPQARVEPAPRAVRVPAIALERVSEQTLEHMMQQATRALNEEDFETAATLFAAAIEVDPDNAESRFRYAYALHMTGAHEAAIEAHKAAAEFPVVRGISLYNLACAYALTDQADAAFEALIASADAGFAVLENMDGDSDLDSIRNDPRFAKLKAELEDDGS